MENFTTQPQTIQVPNYSGVNIQIFNPTVTAGGTTSIPAQQTVNNVGYTTNPMPAYPANYYTQNLATPEVKPVEKANKKEVTVVTNEYIKTLENYLNSEDKEVRTIGAKEVVRLLEEDKSRKTNAAFTALINKMLQDPAQTVRTLALGALENRQIQPNEETVNALRDMEEDKNPYITMSPADITKAKQVLLKTSTTTEKRAVVE
ncbi:MAG: hypothetical protein MJ229_02660 [bacterium]|nr:hypothetical protein [bacterium]